VGSERGLSPLGSLLSAIAAEKIKFLVIGMTGAIMQGAPGVTLDTDLWIDLPSRQYMRMINLALRQGATMVRQTVVALSDGKLVNFCYEIHGVASFRTEYQGAKLMKWEGTVVRVLPLDRIIRSKTAAGREKDLAVLPMLRHIAASRKHLRIRR
jgi:hypothetical protein